MDRLSSELPRAIATAIVEAMAEREDEAREDPMVERVREIRDTLDRFEILLEDISRNTRVGEGA